MGTPPIPNSRTGKARMDLRLSAHNRARLKAAAHALGTSETEVIEILLERGLDVAIER